MKIELNESYRRGKRGYKKGKGNGASKPQEGLSEVIGDLYLNDLKVTRVGGA